MYKRGVSLFLACLMVLSLAACGGSAPETPATTAPAVQAAPTEVIETTEAITEPTLSPEEILIASLPEKVKEAYDLGLVDLELLADLDRVCLGAEAAQIIQNIHVAKHGVESKIMNQLLQHDHAGIEVTRFWLAHTMFLAEAEVIEEAPGETYMENYQHMMNALVKNNTVNDLYEYMFSNSGSIIHANDENYMWYREFELGAMLSVSGVFFPDAEELVMTEELADQQELYVNCTDLTTEVIAWATQAYDRLTGEKLFTVNDDTPFLPREKMTVREVVETALRYHNWIPTQQELLLPYEELPTYDTAIITEDLLAKETALPEASCQYLPESWRGIASKAILAPDSNRALADPKLQENEIQVIKDAGFNFLRLHLNFKYFASDDPNHWPGWLTDPKVGYMNETRLKEVDQIIAWCMERDIHVNLVAQDFAGWTHGYPPSYSDPQKGRQLGQEWAVLAKRYADIPNTYLSFTLQDDPEIWVAKQYGRFFTPMVEAIQAVSPDRCIIAEMSVRGDPGADMAALGVALSAKAAWPEEFHLDGEMKPDERAALFASATWPYTEGDTVYDAESAMVSKRYNCDAPDTVAAVAKEYGVGFMVSGWAPTISSPYPFLSERFTDECMEAYLNDFAAVLKDRGYGWCYGDHNGYVGLFASYPIIESTTYTQVDNAPLYIDDEMMAWFQALNGAA